MNIEPAVYDATFMMLQEMRVAIEELRAKGVEPELVGRVAALYNQSLENWMRVGLEIPASMGITLP